MRTCEVCGISIEHRRSDAKTCSSECQAKRRALNNYRNVRCKRCGIVFVCRAGTMRRYCSALCHSIGHLYWCAECGKRFFARSRTANCCSIKCSQRYRTKTIGRHLRCKACGKSYRTEGSQYCSDVCRDSMVSYVNCKYCGKLFAHKKKFPTWYCTKRCRDKMGNRVRKEVYEYKTIECVVCGRPRPARGRRWSCSKECRYIVRNAHVLGMTIEDYLNYRNEKQGKSEWLKVIRLHRKARRLLETSNHNPEVCQLLQEEFKQLETLQT